MNTPTQSIDLGFRDPLFRGYRLSAHGVITPSGAMLEHLPSEEAAQYFLREFATRLRDAQPETYRLLRKIPLVEAFKTVAKGIARGGNFSEMEVANTVLAWLTAETLDATWANTDPAVMS